MGLHCLPRLSVQRCRFIKLMKHAKGSLNKEPRSVTCFLGLLIWVLSMNGRTIVYCIMWVKLFRHIKQLHFLAHLSRRLIWWAYRIGRPPSYVVIFVIRRHPHSLNIFSSETTGPITVKFHMELQWDGKTKVCSNVLGHMTTMATMPI